MKDTGWAILIVLTLVAASGSSFFLFILIAVIVVSMVSKYRKTGDVPDFGRMVEDFMVHRSRRRKRKKK